MDVVLSNIKKIGGSVHVKSWTGKGTRMTLRLPLTLAVLDVMLVKVAGSPYVIPLSSIVETIQCARANSRMPTGGQVQVRGEYAGRRSGATLRHDDRGRSGQPVRCAVRGRGRRQGGADRR